MTREPCVYIITNFKRTTFYVGVTSDIVNRIREHREGIYVNSFSKRYRLKYLVYVSFFESMEEAIAREKQIKGWSRDRKLILIQGTNPKMQDLYIEEFIKDHS